MVIVWGMRDFGPEAGVGSPKGLKFLNGLLMPMNMFRLGGDIIWGDT